MDQSKFDQTLLTILQEIPPEHLLAQLTAIPGVWELLIEEFNNDVLTRLEEEKQQ